MNTFEFIYETLQKFGYTHPLHPTLTYLPIGLVLAAFVFALFAIVFKRVKGIGGRWYRGTRGVEGDVGAESAYSIT